MLFGIWSLTANFNWLTVGSSLYDGAPITLPFCLHAVICFGAIEQIGSVLFF